MPKDYVSLENLGSGAAVELFNMELQRVLDNIIDPNTKATGAREVTLKVKIKPDEDREYGQVEIHAASKLAPAIPYPTNVYLGKDAATGRGVAREHDPKQVRMFEAEQPKDGVVVPMTQKKEG